MVDGVPDDVCPDEVARTQGAKALPYYRGAMDVAPLSCGRGHGAGGEKEGALAAETRREDAEEDQLAQSRGGGSGRRRRGRDGGGSGRRRRGRAERGSGRREARGGSGRRERSGSGRRRRGRVRRGEQRRADLECEGAEGRDVKRRR